MLVSHQIFNPHSLIVFPNCKINLGLRIIRKRPDGFHDLETLFYPIRLYDILEAIKTSEPENSFQFTSSGIQVISETGTNLCEKAFGLIKQKFPGLPGARLHLHKNIPAGAGLGGGSSDAAFTLRLLNDLYQLNISAEELDAMAIALGSDCPFFLVNKPVLATGRGEIMEPVAVDLSLYNIMLVNPGMMIGTADAFSQIRPAAATRSIKEIIAQPIESWKEDLINDFENVIFKKFPEVAEIKRRFYEAGAIYSSMSGTGSTVYGIFEKEKEVTIRFPGRYFVKMLTG